MSKIIEALQKRGWAKAPVIEQEKPSAQTNLKTSRHSKAQEQLAQVYFSQAPKTSEKAELPAPTIIRVVDKNQSFLWPWILTTIALVLASLALFTTKKISIDVHITDDKSASTTQTPGASTGIASNKEEMLFMSGTSSPTLELKTVPIPTADFSFSGAAILNSSKETNQLNLLNSSLSNLAFAQLNFNPPFNATAHSLYFEARGQKGGEMLEIIFKDSNGNSSLNWKTLIPFENGLSTEWQEIYIPLVSSDFFKPDAVSQIRLEFGSQRTENNNDAMLFVRNMKWVPTKS